MCFSPLPFIPSTLQILNPTPTSQSNIGNAMPGTGTLNAHRGEVSPQSLTQRWGSKFPDISTLKKKLVILSPTSISEAITTLPFMTQGKKPINEGKKKLIHAIPPFLPCPHAVCPCVVWQNHKRNRHSGGSQTSACRSWGRRPRRLSRDGTGSLTTWTSVHLLCTQCYSKERQPLPWRSSWSGWRDKHKKR